MPALVGWILRALGVGAATITPWLVMKILTFLGIGFLGYTALLPLVDQAINTMTSELGASELANWLGLARVDECVSMVASAAGVRMTLGLVRIVRRPVASS